MRCKDEKGQIKGNGHGTGSQEIGKSDENEGEINVESLEDRNRGVTMKIMKKTDVKSLGARMKRDN